MPLISETAMHQATGQDQNQCRVILASLLRDMSIVVRPLSQKPAGFWRRLLTFAIPIAGGGGRILGHLGRFLGRTALEAELQ
jgi:hypothetical protein